MAEEKLLIFDLDGVIVDSVNIVFENVEKIYPGFTWEMYQKALHKQIHEEGMKEFEGMYTKESALEKETRNKMYSVKKLKEVKMHSGMKEVLKDLHSKYILALNTYASEDNSIPLLQKHKVKSLFKMILTKDDGNSKTERSEQIMSELGIDPTNTLYITDATNDIVEAEKAGIQSIAVTWGIHDRHYFEDDEIVDSVIKVVDSPDELLTSIQDHFS